MCRSSASLASRSASATSSSVRMMASGVRSSCDALATKWRWLANAVSSRSSIPSNVSASSLSSSAGPVKPIRSPRFSPETRRAVAMILRSGRSARPASHQPATTETPVIATSATTYSISSRCRAWRSQLGPHGGDEPSVGRIRDEPEQPGLRRG